MYGASYLAGVTAAEACGDNEALVVLANASDSPIALARDSFCDGFGRECKVEYLADDWTGYTSAALAYRKMAEWASTDIPESTTSVRCFQAWTPTNRHCQTALPGA